MALKWTVRDTESPGTINPEIGLTVNHGTEVERVNDRLQAPRLYTFRIFVDEFPKRDFR